MNAANETAYGCPKDNTISATKSKRCLTPDDTVFHINYDSRVKTRVHLGKRDSYDNV